MSSTAILIYCGVLMAISAFNVDMTLPTFAAMSDDLAAPYEQVQWTVTFYMFAAGFAQLLWGSVSDRFGRRAALGAGLSIFLVGSLLAAFAPTIGILLVSRVVQGLGTAAAIVCSRAIIRDRYSGQELARNLAFASAIFAVGPIVAPLVGAAIATPFGWRAVFGVLTGFAGLLLLVLIWLPETIPAKVPDSMRPAVFVRRIGRIVAHPQSRHFLIVSAVVMSAMLLILSAYPRIYDTQFGIRGSVFALFFASHGIGIIVGQTANRRLIPRLGIVRTMAIANGVLILAAALILAVGVAGIANPWLMTALAILFATSYLIVFSNASAMVLDPHGDIAGFTAAVYGFASQIGSSVIVSALVVFVGNSVPVFGAVLLAICLVCFALVQWWRVRRG